MSLALSPFGLYSSLKKSSASFSCGVLSAAPPVWPSGITPYESVEEIPGRIMLSNFPASASKDAYAIRRK